ncbi:MAG: DsbE family thiol:disulfide interchange protein [Gammaproteobacteria bacterium]|jgi:cytochrome c biogenesis protein CcmG, thiol:disulfide interchange protein DsbE
MKSLRYVIPLVIFLALLGLMYKGLYQDPKLVNSPLIGKQVPDFSLPELLDPSKSVEPEQFLGQVWLLNVWGSWCPECWREHGYLKQLSTRHGLTVVGINWRDETADAVDMLRRAGNPYTAIGVDPETTAVLDLGVYGAPESYLIDKQGIIRFKQVGAVTPQLWNSELEALVKRLQSEG